jgi:putative cell wall-binding protein
MRHLSGRPARIVAAAVAGMTAAGVASAVGLSAHATASVTVNRVAGSDRYQTSAMIAEAKYPSGVPGNNVVLATGLNFPDALAGNYLAGQLGSPILLTPQTTTDPAYSTVTTALGKLLPGPIRQVTILGGTSAVGADVASDLQSKGYLVTRIGGATRYDTAQMVDTQSGQTPGKGTSGNPTAILATGQNFPDALAAGPVAWKQKFPIVLTDGTKSTLSPQAQSTLTTDKIQNVMIMGGSAAINPGINTSLAALGIKIDKQFAGADRTDTAAQLASYAQSTYGFGTTSLILASGQSFADALSAGPWGGDPQDIYLTATTDSIGTYTTNAIKALSGTLTTINIAGGTAAVDNNAQQQAQAAAQNVSSNATYAVTPAAAQTVNTSSSAHGNAVFQVANLGTPPVDIVLFNCSNVENPNGSYTFAGSNPGGSGDVAVPGTVSHETISVVNGAAQSSPGTAVNGVSPSNGTLSFTVANDGTPGECVTPVVFQKTANDQLPLGAGNAPTVPFGAGAPTTFVVPASAGSFGGGAGSTAPTDTVTSFTSKSFTTANGTYTYGSGDTYQLFSSNGVMASCTTTTLAVFQAALSAGDKVGGNYQPASTSTFCLNDIAPAAPGAVTATQNSATGGVSLAFTDSTSPDVTGYNVYRATASNNGVTGAPFTCPTLPAPSGSQASPQTPPSTSTSWTKIGSVADTTIGSATGNNNYTFNDPTLAPSSGTAPLYCYAVSSVAPSAAGTEESTGAPANTNSTASSSSGGQTAGSQGIAPAPAPAPTSSGAPKFQSATAQGLTVTVTYSAAINSATVDKGDFTVTYGTAADGTGTQTADPVTNASGSGTTAYVELTNPVPTGDYALVKAATGSDSNTVCASGGTTSCETVGDQVISGAASAAGAAPTMNKTGSSASSSSQKIILAFSAPIDCATVDSMDWGVTAPVPVPVSAAACSDSSGASVTTLTSPYVTLSVAGIAPGSSVTVTAQKGSDGNTVIDPAAGAAEATGDSITLTAT